MQNFWENLPKPFFVLAPMEAVTDVVFRHVIAAAARPDVFFTEFTNAASFASPKGIHGTRGRLTFTPDEQPMVAHIWGNDPDHFAHMAAGMAELGFLGIDINTGCPDKAVVKQGSGAGLIGNYQLMGELIAAAKTAGLPVSVKARLGNTRVDEWHDWLGFLLQQDLANLSIHLRTRKEMSKVPAHYELIPEIKALRDAVAPQTLLTINGDIKNRAHGEELVRQFGVDGVMIGRGVFADPFAFSRAEDGQSAAYLREPLQPEPLPKIRQATGQSPSQSGQKQQLLNLLRLHLDLHDKYSARLEPRKFDPLKRFFKIYVREFDGAAELRDKLMQTKNTDEVRQLIGG